MAPMTRSTALVSHANRPANGVPKEMFRQPSLQFQDSGLSERQVSEEPPSSYDESDMNSTSALDEEDEDYDYDDKAPVESPEDHEDILHPLRETANRVGREVERFAEVLDGYNPLRAAADDERREMAFDLIDLYHNIALDTLDRLREQHASERRKKDGLRWRKKMRGFKITQDEDEMDLEESDEQDGPYAITQTTLEDLERWEQEAQTWDLLKRLVQLRFPQPSNEPAPEPLEPINQYSTERQVWDHFLQSDGLALERRTVLRWLKDTAEDSGEDIDVLVQDLQQNAERGDIIAHGWLHTKETIKGQKRNNTWSTPLDPALPQVQRALVQSNGEPLVTQLDPDSTTRQGRKLVAQDEYFERAIWMGCYEMLRRGKSATDIREWCVERTEIWRAVSMSGLPDEKPEGEDDGANPASTALWRRMCFALARKGGGDEYERAVYGILSGDIQSVEPVCRTWDDFVFAHYNALLRTQFDDYIQTFPNRAMAGAMSNFGIFDAVQFHGDPQSAGKRLVETLKTDPRTAAETMQPMKMIQGVLIADQFNNFIYQQGLALAQFANERGVSNLIPPSYEEPEKQDITKYIGLNDDHDSLRVITHILLIFTSLGVDFGGISRRGVIENVIVAYISFLRLAGKEELIPLYCSQLSGSRRYATLSRNLIDVIDHEQRVTQIKLMRELGLDVQEFVKFQSRYLFTDYPDESRGYPATGKFRILEAPPGTLEAGRAIRKDFFGDDGDQVERVDMLFIRSLEWYLLVDGLWSETFTIGTMLYLRFFKHIRLNAARMLASRIPSTTIAQIKTRAFLGESLDFISLEAQGEDGDLTEVLDGSADQKRLLKRHLLAEAKNYRELETLIESLDNMETVTSLGHIMHENPSPKWQKQWRYKVADALQPARASVQPLLKGWLTSSQRDQPQLALLREAYLPETILAYISLLQFAGGILSRDFLMQCMELSADIAAEDSDLLVLFQKTGRMQELVDAFALASKALLIMTSEKKGTSSKSKKLRVKGWSQELWNIKK